MTIQVKELTLRDFTRAKISLYNKTGDFHNLSGLIPSRSTPGRIERAPNWAAFVAFTELTDCEAIFFDQANKRFVFIGTDDGDDLATEYCSIDDWTMSAIQDIAAATGLAGLGGHRGRNVIYFEGSLFLIGDDNKLYQTANYATTAVAEFDADAFNCLCVYGDRFYGAKTDGSIERLNDAGNAMEAHWTANNADMIWDYLTGYRGYLYGLATLCDGRRVIVQVDSAEATTPSFQIMAELHDIGIEHDKGCTYIQHENYLYFMPGLHTTYIDGAVPTEPAFANIYRYRFSSAGTIELVATLDTNPYNYFYLLNWNGHLLLAELYEYATAALAFHKVHTEGAGMSMSIPRTADTEGLEVFAHSSHACIIVTSTLDTDEGFYQIGPDTGYQDGYLETSWLDMDHLGKVKRLDTLTVHMDNAETNFKVLIKYRVDEDTSLDYRSHRQQ